MSSKHSNIQFFASPYLHDIIQELQPICDCSKSFSPNRKWRPSLYKSDWLPRQRAETNSIWYKVNFAEKSMTEDINFFANTRLAIFIVVFPVHQNQNIARPNRARRRQRQAANSSYNSGTSASSGKKKLFFHGTSSQRINSEFTHDLVSKSRESNNDILWD